MIKFTKEEKIVLIFLIGVLFAGTAAFYFKKLLPGVHRFIEFNEGEVEESKKININKATKEELIIIKGVGPVLAGRIIAYREENGPFQAKEDVKNVKGIGEKTFEKLKNQIVLE